ncbi:6114_t:CDS:1, partial [Racocetra persica]
NGCENQNPKTIKDFFFKKVAITQPLYETTLLFAILNIASVNENGPSTEQRERIEQ